MDNAFCFARFKGKKQGDFKGESQRENFDGWVECLSFSHSMSVSIQRFGSDRQVSPPTVNELVITKFFGEASVQINQALATRELLEKVELTCVRSTPEGQDEQWYQITLKEAMVTSVNYANSGDQRVVETVSLGFRSIAWAFMTDSLETDFSWKE